MNKKAWLVVLIAGVAVGTASAAELKMQWDGEAAGDRTISLAVGEQADVQIIITLLDGEVVNTVFYTNDSTPELDQIGVAANDALNWLSDSTDGTLGGGLQQLALGVAAVGSDIVGPGEFLIGTQTIALTSGSAGQSLNVTFDTDFPIGVVSGTGSFFTRVATASPLVDTPGVYHLGAGSPGYSGGGADDAAEPLIVEVAAGDGGDGGGGVTPPPGDDDDTGDDDTGDDDTGDDDTGDDDDNNVGDDDDPVGDDDGGTGGGGDGGIDTDGDGVDDDQDNDDDGDGVPDRVDNDPLDPNVGRGGSQGGGGAAAPGPCGVGILGAMPIGLFGWLMLATYRRR